MLMLNDDYSELIAETVERVGGTLTQAQIDEISDAIYQQGRHGYLSRAPTDRRPAAPIPAPTPVDMRLVGEALRIAYKQRDPVELRANGDVVRVTDGVVIRAA